MDESNEYEFDDDPFMLERLPWLETPLDPRHPCIRILRLHPGAYNSPITCSLQVVSLDDNPEYESLSYVWGDPKKTKPITVGGEIFNATESLVNFLGCLRQQATVWVWVDAICIDQTNNEEKGRQIQLMTRIYRQAKQAHIWFGSFTPSWTDEIRGDSGEFVPACEWTPDDWNGADRMLVREELENFQRAGGKAQKEREFIDRDGVIMLQTLIMLDEIAAGKHFHELPLFSVANDAPTGAYRYIMNRHLLEIHDCLRWLLSRPWWTRVWTLQEAVLPRVDPIIHASPFAFPLSRLFNGIKGINEHSNNCCKKLTPLFYNTGYSRTRFEDRIRAWAVYEHREMFAESEPFPSTPIGEAIDSSRGRKATVPQDHFFGILGLQDPEIQERWFAAFGFSGTTAEIFSRCTKLLYDIRRSLVRLGEARGVKGSIVNDLPSWAIDLTAEIPPSYDGNQRWELFDASPNTRFEGFNDFPDLVGRDLQVNAIPIGTVGVCAEPPSTYDMDLLDSPRGPGVILRHVIEWERLYANYARPPDFDKFWRAARMDRDIRKYYMHKRFPLPAQQLAEIQQWWMNWKQTHDSRDLYIDPRFGDSKLGDYHYRALKLNFEKHLFFCSVRGEPGIGPMEAQPFDEIFVLQGCSAPAILRRRLGSDGFSFVGLCYVEGWMRGKAIHGQVQWQTVTLY